MTKLNEVYYLHREQPFPDVSLIPVALERLEAAGMLALAEPDENDGLATVVLTEAGLARYRELDLDQRRRRWSDLT